PSNDQVVLAEEVALCRHHEVTRAALACKCRTTDGRGRYSGRLAEHKLGRRGKLVGDGDHGRVQLVPRGVTLTLEVEQRPDPGDADRDVSRSLAPRSAERVAHDHADFGAGQLAKALP